MTDDKTEDHKNSNAVTKPLPDKWQSAEKALRAIQWAFDLGNSVQEYIRVEAARNAITPSDCIRTILQLNVRSKRTRPRLTLSLNDKDLDILAQRYNLERTDTVKIKARAAEEIIDHVNKAADVNAEN